MVSSFPGLLGFIRNPYHEIEDSFQDCPELLIITSLFPMNIVTSLKYILLWAKYVDKHLFSSFHFFVVVNPHKNGYFFH